MATESVVNDTDAVAADEKMAWHVTMEESNDSSLDDTDVKDTIPDENPSGTDNGNTNVEDDSDMANVETLVRNASSAVPMMDIESLLPNASSNDEKSALSTSEMHKTSGQPNGDPSVNICKREAGVTHELLTNDTVAASNSYVRIKSEPGANSEQDTSDNMAAVADMANVETLVRNASSAVPMMDIESLLPNASTNDEKSALSTSETHKTSGQPNCDSSVNIDRKSGVLHDLLTNDTATASHSSVRIKSEPDSDSEPDTSDKMETVADMANVETLVRMATNPRMVLPVRKRSKRVSNTKDSELLQHLAKTAKTRTIDTDEVIHNDNNELGIVIHSVETGETIKEEFWNKPEDLDSGDDAITYHACSICEQLFRSEDILHKHEETHTGDRVPCIFCNRLYKSRSKKSLYKHVKECIQSLKPEPHTPTPFGCTMCPLEFSVRGSLLSHALQEHLGIDSCNYVSSNSATISCMFCNRPYANKGSRLCLVKHVTMCTENIKPNAEGRFVCTGCDSKSNSREELIQHALQHMLRLESKKDLKDAKKVVKNLLAFVRNRKKSNTSNQEESKTVEPKKSKTVKKTPKRPLLRKRNGSDYYSDSSESGDSPVLSDEGESKSESEEEEEEEEENDLETAFDVYQAMSLDHANQIEPTEFETVSELEPMYYMMTDPVPEQIAEPRALSGKKISKPSLNLLHQCAVCLKRFRKPSDVEIHLRVHTGERPFRCMKCGIKFTRKTTQQGHLVRCKLKHLDDLPEDADAEAWASRAALINAKTPNS